MNLIFLYDSLERTFDKKVTTFILEKGMVRRKDRNERDHSVCIGNRIKVSDI